MASVYLSDAQGLKPFDCSETVGVFPHAGKDGFARLNCLRREKKSKMSIRRRLYCCILPN